MKRLLILTVILNTLSDVAIAEKIVIATIDWCPFICPNDTEKPGLLVEVTRQIYRGSDTHITFINYPWSRAIKLTMSGQTVALLAPAKHETPELRFPPTEIGIQKFCVFTRTDKIWPYTGPESLQGKIILYPQDALPDQVARVKGIKLHARAYAENYIAHAIKLTLNNRLDGFLMTLLSTKHYLSQHDMKQRISAAGCVDEQQIYLAFTPAPGKSDLVNRLIQYYENAMNKTEKANLLKTLLKKYQID